MKNNEDQVLATLGLCRRAGKLAAGEEAVMQAIRSKEAKLVILSDDASDGTAKKVSDKCTFYEIPMIRKFSRGMIGWAIGQEARVMIAVLDDGFAKLIKQRIDISTEVTGD